MLLVRTWEVSICDAISFDIFCCLISASNPCAGIVVEEPASLEEQSAVELGAGDGRRRTHDGQGGGDGHAGDGLQRPHDGQGNGVMEHRDVGAARRAATSALMMGGAAGDCRAGEVRRLRA